MAQDLENPLRADAGLYVKAFHPRKIVTKFHLSAYVEMIEELEPKLRFGKNNDIIKLTPDIHETRESESTQSKEVLATPNGSKLHRNVTGHFYEVFVQKLKIQRILEFSIMQEPVNASQKSAIHRECERHV